MRGVSSSDAKHLLALWTLWDHEGAYAACGSVDVESDIRSSSDDISSCVPWPSIRAPSFTLDADNAIMPLATV